MILAAHPASFLPEIEIFQILVKCDVFIIADNVQYSTHSQMNRCRIKTNVGIQWLTVPVISKHQQRQKVNEAQINNDVNWRQKIIKTLHSNYKCTPFFEYYIPYFEKTFSEEYENLATLNIALLETCMKLIGFQRKIIIASDADICWGKEKEIAAIVKQNDCEAYLCGSELHPFLDENKLAQLSVDYLKPVQPLSLYRQLFGDFAANLSIVDLIFNEGPETIRLLKNR